MNEPKAMVKELSLREMFEYVRVRELVDLLQRESDQDDYALQPLETSRLRSESVHQHSANDEPLFRFTMFDEAERASFHEAMLSTEPDFSMRNEFQ